MPVAERKLFRSLEYAWNLSTTQNVDLPDAPANAHKIEQLEDRFSNNL